MPTYEYKCSKCGHQFELFQSMTAKPSRKCPECRGSVKRLPGTGGLLLFKGSGFYETDYKKKAAAPSSADSGGTDKPAAADSTSQASAPAKDAAPKESAPAKDSAPASSSKPAATAGKK